ncbi:SLATT domain-containing protein [Hymenobacter rubidus]|uniref:SLATT domain-containing protein n=1 Tax=Hymenobacter rubidus TaxID=1441626 RepID=UPI00191DE170|nr:SLATT domain-containing protein [Hymenobacter rubidus]
MEPTKAPVESVIQKWYDRVSATQYAHYSSSRYYSSRNLWLGVPAVVLSTIVGTTVFASIKAERLETWAQIAVGLASVLAAVLTGLQTLLGFSTLAEKHRLAGAKYGVIGRELEYLLAVPTNITPAIIGSLQKRLEDLAIESVNNPKSIYRNAVAALESAEPGKHPSL